VKKDKEKAKGGQRGGDHCKNIKIAVFFIFILDQYPVCVAAPVDSPRHPTPSPWETQTRRNELYSI
jgi:hypothetical protein